MLIQEIQLECGETVDVAALVFLETYEFGEKPRHPSGERNRRIDNLAMRFAARCWPRQPLVSLTNQRYFLNENAEHLPEVVCMAYLRSSPQMAQLRSLLAVGYQTRASIPLDPDVLTAIR